MSLPIITIQGTNFISEGKIWKYIGVDGFALPARDFMASGREALTGPFFDEWDTIKKEAGLEHPLVVRAFAVAAPPNPFALNPHDHPDFYPRIANLVDYAASRGYYLNLTGGDYQLTIPNEDGPQGQQQHMNEMNSCLVGRMAFLEDCNEPFKNGMNPANITVLKVGDTLRVSGCYGAGYADFNPVRDFIDFHPDRSGGEWFWPKFLYDLPTSAAVIMGEYPTAPCIFDEPMGFGPSEPGRRSDNPLYANMMGRILSWLAGVTFHSTDGAFCNALSPVTRACAVEFLKGAKTCL